MIYDLQFVSATKKIEISKFFSVDYIKLRDKSNFFGNSSGLLVGEKIMKFDQIMVVDLSHTTLKKSMIKCMNLTFSHRI